MTNTTSPTWKRFTQYYREYPELGLALDLSRVDFPDDFFARNRAVLAEAFAAMEKLEAGAVANPDENRRVGHYWLRDAARAPETERQAILDTITAIAQFAAKAHAGVIAGEGGRFEHLLLVGIGGSALGPQFVAHALGHPRTDKLALHCFDNTDPDGMDRVLARLEGRLGQTLCIVISKSGGTKETENGLKEARAAYQRAGLHFERHAVAVTMAGSNMDKLAKGSEPPGTPWLDVFRIWDWVGGRTSETSAVGLLPARLQGIDTAQLLAGARACDIVTRRRDPLANPAAQLALMWHHLGQGEKDMVVIPYKDRLELFSRYLQQLVMESLGKEGRYQGAKVHHGIAVYGNKGSTDQHAYIQQLRDGRPNFFVTFIEVLKDRGEGAPALEVEPGVTSGDYLSGFLLGTRRALHEKGRPSITLTLAEVTPFTVGVLIALFERAVGLYASLIGINAYHQPGVQAGKLAADDVIALQHRIADYFAGAAGARAGGAFTAEEVAAALGAADEVETVFKTCQHLSANPGRGLRRTGGMSAADARFAPE
jgi:glucose-6-phosphate isomerase